MEDIASKRNKMDRECALVDPPMEVQEEVLTAKMATHEIVPEEKGSLHSA